jgi:hypothetical protein
MKLSITSCPVCQSDFLVGIDGRDIRKTPHSGNKEDDSVPFIAFGQEDLDSSPLLPKGQLPCKACGKPCDVIEF